MLRGTPVKVSWLDADCEAGWINTSEEGLKAQGNVECVESYGVFIEQNKDFIILSFAYNEQGEQALGGHRIPRGMIKKIEFLEVRGQKQEENNGEYVKLDEEQVR